MSREVVVPVVVDTNILVPSLYRSTPVLQFILNGNLVLVWNQFIYDEAYRITNEMWQTYYSKKFDISYINDVIELLNLVFKLGYSVPEMPENWPCVFTDRNDDPFLWAALTGKAEFIISHDRRHMIRLRHINGIPIGPPRRFFNWAKIIHPI